MSIKTIIEIKISYLMKDILENDSNFFEEIESKIGVINKIDVLTTTTRITTSITLNYQIILNQNKSDKLILKNINKLFKKYFEFYFMLTETSYHCCVYRI